MNFYTYASDFYYDSPVSTLNYYITVKGETIYRGKAVKSPARENISINIGKRVRDWIELNMPDFRDYDGVVVPHPDAMLVFNLYDSNDTLLEQYTVIISESKETEEVYGLLSEPINGNADPRQKIFYGCSSEIGGLVEVTTSETIERYFRFTTPNGQYIDPSATEFTVNWDTNYPYIVYEYSGTTAMTFDSGATLHFPALEDSGRTLQHRIKAYSPNGTYLGSLVWIQGVFSYANEYLTFDILSGGTIVLDGYSPRSFMGVSYSKDDGENWTFISSSNNDVHYSIDVNAGEKVIWKGYYGFSDRHFTHSTAVFNLEGNLMSTYCSDDFYGKTHPTYPDVYGGCSYAFSGAKVVYADNMVWRFTELMQGGAFDADRLNGMFEGMFSGCTMLIAAPEIDTIVRESNKQRTWWIFKYMFAGCTSLVKAPSELHISVGAVEACYGMFSGCTSLETATIIPRIETAYRNCFSNMFYGCTSLKNVQEEIYAALSPSTPSGSQTAANLFAGMFGGCASLETAPNLTAEVVGKRWYMGMFAGCTSLANAPVISATTLLDEGESDTPHHPNYDGRTITGDYRFYKIKGAFKQMFKDCTSLVTPPVFLATTDFTDSYEETFKGCTSLASLVSSTGITGCRMYENCVSLTGVTRAPGGIFAIEEFKGCTSITGVTYTGFGEGMFLGCTSLTSVSQFAYSSSVGMCDARCMFSGCTSLSSVPYELSPTSLSERCYEGMFRGCTSLNRAPSLPASILKPYSYAYMFDGCANLSSIRCLATEKKVDDAPTFQWIRGVTNQSGTFTKKSGVSWSTTGSGSYYNGVPVGWTITEVQ